jgi:signal transduction histidine kinase/streptogramin lyase
VYRRLTYFICCLILVSDLYGQLARQYSFTHYGTANGLASNYVFNVVQDDDGFIWISTINGLQRFDGNRFLTFQNEPGNPQSIPSEFVAGAFKDKKNNLWIVTNDNKIGAFNPKKQVYREASIKYRSDKKTFAGKFLFETSDGKLMMHVLGDGMYSYNIWKNEFVQDSTTIVFPPKWTPFFLYREAARNNYWMACDSGIAVFNYKTRHLSYRGHNIDNDPVINEFRNELHTYNLHIDSLNRVFLVKWPPDRGGPWLMYYNMGTGQRINYNLAEQISVGYHEINGFQEQHNGRLWVYGMPFIAEFTNGDKPFQEIRNAYKDEQSIKFDKVNTMYEDRQQNLWISTTNGLYLFNPEARLFNNFNLVRPDGKGVVEGAVISALEYDNKQLWVGMWGSGLYAYDEDQQPVEVPKALQPLKDNLSIWCMVQDSSSKKVWMGLQEGQLLVYDPITEKVDKFFPKIFNGNTIRQVTEDKLGNLWFGTQAGTIIKWDKKLSGGDVHTGYSLFMRSGLVNKLTTDKDGFVWVGTMGYGIYRIDPASNNIVEHISNDGPSEYRLSSESVSDILQYNDSLILVASRSLDIINTKTKTVTHITSREGLPSNSVMCVQKDTKGIVWLGMVNGICRVDLEKKIFTNYDRRDGIANDNFNPAGAFAMKDGRMVFTTDHNFAIFDPGKAVRNLQNPEVKITDFRLMNNSLPVDSLEGLKRISVDYDQNSINIEFNALSYLKQKKVIYYYKLEGLDKNWIRSDERQVAVYNYLPPGDYTFLVRGENEDGTSGDKITKLEMRVQSPFWRTWWFYGLLALIAIGIFYLIDKERVRRFITLQQVRTQIAGSLHQDINTTLNNINLLSELARIKADKDIDKSKEFIDQIHEKSQRMIEAMDDMLWSIHPENDSMKKTLERMAEYAQGLQFTYGFKVQMFVDDNVRSLRLDMKSRHEIFLIFKESLNNIARHAAATMADINIDMVKSRLLMKIQDNGKGFDPHHSLNGQGFSEIKKRAAVLNAVVDIQSDRKGTAVILSVPI